MKFFNFHYKKKRSSAVSIGIIGGADGPTAIFTSSHEEQDRFLSLAAEKIKPCEKTFEQLEQYLVSRYHAVHHTLLPHELRVLKANVIVNHFSEVLDKPKPLSDNPTQQEINAYCEKDIFGQGREYPAEKLGLDMRAYKIAKEIIPIAKKRLFNKREQYGKAHSSYGEDDMIIEIEMKSGYFSILNGTDEVMNDLILYRGVSGLDIAKRTPRFIGYAYTLKNLDKL